MAEMCRNSQSSYHVIVEPRYPRTLSSSQPTVTFTSQITIVAPTYVQKPSIEKSGAIHSASEESFAKIVAGEQNPTTAYMTGKLKIKGDMGAAMKLQKLF